jgi:hypothetical protein
MISSGIEHAVFQLVARCLNQLRYRVSLKKITVSINCSEEVWLEEVDWMLLIRDIVQRRALVNMVMNFRFPNKAPNFLNSKETVKVSKAIPLTGLEDP